MEYISLQPCPICGEHPEFVKESLARPGGGGYPGHYTYQYKCECCKLLKTQETTDIYDKIPELAKNRAKEDWNTEVDRVLEYLNRQWVPKVLVEYNCV